MAMQARGATAGLEVVVRTRKKMSIETSTETPLSRMGERYVDLGARERYALEASEDANRLSGRAADGLASWDEAARAHRSAAARYRAAAEHAGSLGLGRLARELADHGAEHSMAADTHEGDARRVEAGGPRLRLQLGRGRDHAGRSRSGPRVTDTNLYVLQEVADAVELYGAPVRRFSPTSAPHLRRLIGFGLLERVGLAGLPGSSTIGERVGFHADPRAPGWAPSAAGYAALEERRRAYPALAAATGLRDPDPERRERYVRMLRQEMQP